MTNSHDEALMRLHQLISYVQDEGLRHSFNKWINDNLHKVECHYSMGAEGFLKHKEIGQQAEQYAKDALFKKLSDVIIDAAQVKTTEYVGYPYSHIVTASALVVMRRSHDR